MRCVSIGALVAAVGMTGTIACADLIVGETLTIIGTSPLGPWGTGVFGGPEHIHGFETTYFLSGEDDSGKDLDPIFVFSEPLPPPPGKRSAGYISFDFSEVDDDFFEGEDDSSQDFLSISIFGIKKLGVPGENPINSVEASFGFAFTDGFSIFWIFDGKMKKDDMDSSLNHENDIILTIAWTQVPAPGSLALLGLAGLCGARRRRH